MQISVKYQVNVFHLSMVCWLIQSERILVNEQICPIAQYLDNLIELIITTSNKVKLNYNDFHR